MPIYEYQCEKCGKVEERFFSMKEKPSEIVQKCECSEDDVIFLSIMSAPPIISGVSGFKVNGDFRDRLKQIKKNNPGMQSTVTG